MGSATLRRKRRLDTGGGSGNGAVRRAVAATRQEEVQGPQRKAGGSRLQQQSFRSDEDPHDLSKPSLPLECLIPPPWPYAGTKDKNIIKQNALKTSKQGHSQSRGQPPQ